MIAVRLHSVEREKANEGGRETWPKELPEQRPQKTLECALSGKESSKREGETVVRSRNCLCGGERAKEVRTMCEA